MTDEEWEADADNRIKRVLKARAAIVEQIGEWRRKMMGVSGSVDCPICGAKGGLSYSRAYNGHIGASCTTEGCVAWRE